MNSEEEPNAKHYWRFILPLVFILALMVKYPLRIALPEISYDVFFYGAISLICVAIAIQVYWRFRKRGLRLIAALLLCSVLSGWQVFDLLVLRVGSPGVWGFGPGMSQSFTDHDGLAWYELRFPNNAILSDSLFEKYFGNEVLAVTVEINRDASWFACGG